MCEVISRSPSPYGSDSDEVWDILMSDSSVSEETPLLKKPRHSGRTRVYLAACTVYLANFSFGAALGYPSPALPDIRKRIPLSDSSNDWFGAFSSISAIIGGLAGGQLVGIAGRRGTILLSSLGSVLGFLLIEVTPIIGVIFAGRALTGFSMGIIATSTPTFIGEISPQNIRGALVSLSALSTSFGIMFVYTLGKWLDYQWLAVACMAPAVVMAVIMPWVAESPRWLMQIGRTEEAKKAFQFYRDSEEDGDFEALYVNAIHTTKVSLRHLRRPHVWKPILYTTIGSTLQPLSGIVVVLSYAHDIFQAAGSTIGPVDCAIIMDIMPPRDKATTFSASRLQQDPRSSSSFSVTVSAGIIINPPAFRGYMDCGRRREACVMASRSMWTSRPRRLCVRTEIWSPPPSDDSLSQSDILRTPLFHYQKRSRGCRARSVTYPKSTALPTARGLYTGPGSMPPGRPALLEKT